MKEVKEERNITFTITLNTTIGTFQSTFMVTRDSSKREIVSHINPIANEKHN